MQDLPQQWRELSGFERDILFTVYQTGGWMGRDVYETIGQCDGRESDTRFYDRVDDLIDAGLLRREKSDDAPNAKGLYITADGDLLVETVQERWRKL